MAGSKSAPYIPPSCRSDEPSSRPLLVSHHRTQPSAQTVTTARPSGENTACSTIRCGWGSGSRTSCLRPGPRVGPYHPHKPSAASRSSSGWNRTEKTTPGCGIRTGGSPPGPPSVAHTCASTGTRMSSRTVIPSASSRPSGLKATGPVRELVRSGVERAHRPGRFPGHRCRPSAGDRDCQPLAIRADGATERRTGDERGVVDHPRSTTSSWRKPSRAAVDRPLAIGGKGHALDPAGDRGKLSRTSPLRVSTRAGSPSARPTSSSEPSGLTAAVLTLLCNRTMWRSACSRAAHPAKLRRSTFGPPRVVGRSDPQGLHHPEQAGRHLPAAGQDVPAGNAASDVSRCQSSRAWSADEPALRPRRDLIAASPCSALGRGRRVVAPGPPPATSTPCPAGPAPAPGTGLPPGPTQRGGAGPADQPPTCGRSAGPGPSGPRRNRVRSSATNSGRGVPAGRVLLQADQADRLQIARDAAGQREGGVDDTLDLFQDAQRRRPVKRLAPREQFVEDGPEGVHVGRRPNGRRSPVGLLGRHVIGRPDQSLRPG